MHKDQKRVDEALVPRIMAKITGSSPTDVEDCTILNRALIQGPDPLFLMLTCPEHFEVLCTLLMLTVEEGTKAITDAHWKGPSCLLEGKGLPIGEDLLLELLSPKNRQEALWVLLASVSNCTEEGYKAEVTLRERFQRTHKAVAALAQIVYNHIEGYDQLEVVAASIASFVNKTPVYFDSDYLPHTNADHGFYVLYKKGYKAVAVHTTGPTFIGTVESTSLADMKLRVDKFISPQFGLRFEDSLAAWDALVVSATSAKPGWPLGADAMAGTSPTGNLGMGRMPTYRDGQGS